MLSFDNMCNDKLERKEQAVLCHVLICKKKNEVPLGRWAGTNLVGHRD